MHAHILASPFSTEELKKALERVECRPKLGFGSGRAVMLGWCRWIGWAPFWRWHWSNGERTQYWIVCNSRTLRVLSFVCAELGVEYCDRFMAQGESLSHDNGAPDAQLGWSVAATRGHISTKRLPERGKKSEKWEAGEGDGKTQKMGGGRGKQKLEISVPRPF